MRSQKSRKKVKAISAPTNDSNSWAKTVGADAFASALHQGAAFSHHHILSQSDFVSLFPPSSSSVTILSETDLT
jgi:hypothetical protein